MADFAALGRTHATSLAGGIRRKIVMQHEAVGVFALQRVDFLRIAHAPQSRHHDGLCFAAGE